jgi:WD40-like Beta Propeller Repeat
LAHGHLGQFGYIGRLEFNPAPKTGEPLAPRYELTQVTRLFQEGLDQEVLTRDPQHPDRLKLNDQGITVGEFRGFSKNGREVFYVGYPFESCNIDVFAVDLMTGKVRRLTSHPEYVDPLDASPDDKWMVIEDTRGSDRQMFLAAMRSVPPIIDLVTTSAVSSVRNNGDRRFFQPWLLDQYGDRGDYYGQQLNAGDEAPGSPSDPNWNAMADPRWSPDGTRVVYWQAQVTSPACGGSNPLPCPPSTEPGGRRVRVMMARLTTRKPISVKPPAPISDTVPWGKPYVPGSPTPNRALLPEGTYTMSGTVSGSAKVSIIHNAEHSAIQTVAVTYDNYSDKPGTIINGTESATETRSKPTTTTLDWHSNLAQSGKTHGSKVTSPDGFKLTIDVMTNIFQATGTLTTTVNGQTYKQPANGT